jgi:dimethylamine/trimethylamine dehydrogenase
VTPLAAPAMYTAYTGELVDLVPLLVGLGVELVTSHVVTGVEPGRISGHPTAFPGMSVGWDADAIVLATQRVAEDRLYRDLTADPVALEDAGIEAVYRVGDCLAPRQQAADAIFDAHRLAREIDSDDPAEPRPYIRERRVVGAVDADYEAILELRSGSRG